MPHQLGRRTASSGGRDHRGQRPPAGARQAGRGDELVAGDVDRWLELSDLAEQAGVELLEWFVIGDAITCPRDLLGEPPRW